MSKYISHDQIIAQRVLNKVSELLKKNNQTLPEEGILTGQSVATLYLEEIGFSKYKETKSHPINDIDVFRFVDKDEGGNGFFEKFEDPSLEYEGYRHLSIEQTMRTKYLVVDTKHDGLLNETSVFLLQKSESVAENMKALISLFDINVTQIAIDIKTKTLVRSVEFEKFVQTGQLRVVDIATPFHTAIRFCKKMDEFGFYGDVEKEMLILQASMFAKKATNFGRKYLQLYKKYEQTLNRFFKIERNVYDFEDRVFYSWKLIPRETKQYLDLMRFAKDSGFMVFNRLWIGEIKEMMSIYYSSKGKKQIHARLSQEKIDDLLFNLVRRFVAKEEISLKAVKSLNKTLKQHEAMIFPFWEMDSFKKLAEWNKHIRKLEKEYGVIVWGVAEKNKLSSMSFEEFEEKIKETLKEALLPLITQSIQPLETNKWILKELTTGLELIEEGEAMKHCVGGYNKMVEAERSKIVSLLNKEKDERITVELSSNGSSWSFAQIRGFANAPIDKETQEEVKELIKEQAVGIEIKEEVSPTQDFWANLEPENPVFEINQEEIPF